MNKRNLTTFSLSRAMITISPKLKMMPKTSMFLTKVLKNNSLLTLIAIPPLVSSLKIATRVLITSTTAFTCSTFTMKPLAFTVRGLTRDLLIILFYLTKIRVMAYKNVSRNLIKFARDCMLLYFLPVSLVISLNWLNTKLPGAFNTSLFLHAVLASPMILSNNLPVRELTNLFKSTKALSRLLKSNKPLEMNSAILPTLKLPIDIGNRRMTRVSFEEITSHEVLIMVLRVVQSTKPIHILYSLH